MRGIEDIKRDIAAMEAARIDAARMAKELEAVGILADDVDPEDEAQRIAGYSWWRMELLEDELAEAEEAEAEARAEAYFAGRRRQEQLDEAYWHHVNAHGSEPSEAETTAMLRAILAEENVGIVNR
ncbi:MAG: hypothetical protein M3P49_06835 [Actinomycetota bacterium]|nr:hypothetical protein [Actinomycetota bacterium]